MFVLRRAVFGFCCLFGSVFPSPSATRCLADISLLRSFSARALYRSGGQRNRVVIVHGKDVIFITVFTRYEEALLSPIRCTSSKRHDIASSRLCVGRRGFPDFTHLCVREEGNGISRLKGKGAKLKEEEEDWRDEGCRNGFQWQCW